MHEVNPGSYHADSIAMTAGQELSVRVFTMFDFDDLLPHDWSLVALADQTAVTIAHKDGIQSSVFSDPPTLGANKFTATSLMAVAALSLSFVF